MISLPGWSKKEKSVATRQKDRRFFRWRLLNCFLFGVIFSLGILILTLHLKTWGRNFYNEVGGKWVETECEVKGLYSHSRQDFQGHLRYRPEVQIEYEVNDKTYLVHTFDNQTLFQDRGFLYDRQTVENKLKYFERGRRIPCWYREDDPSQVILVRQQDYWGWFFLVIPVTLIFLGGGGLAVLLFRRHRSLERCALHNRRSVSPYPTVPQTDYINESPGTELAYRLPVVFFPVFQLLLAFFLMVLWNVLAWSIFIYLLAHRTGWVDLFLAVLFGFLFCGAGLVFLPWIINLSRSALTVGTTILEISDHPVVPGRKHRLSFTQNGRLRAESCEIYVLCREIARYRQGTDTVTNTREVWRQTLYRKEQMIIPTGQTLKEDFFLQLPIGVMHSMESFHNEVVWNLVIEIILPNQRTVRRLCPLIILPYTLRSEL